MDGSRVDVVVRTSHGEAELSLHVHDADMTLGEVVARVTGVAAPRVCLVDGRPVPSTSPIAEVGLLDGSIVATADDEPAAPGIVELVQVAGRGSGTRVALPAGTFLLGPGQRVNAPELDSGAVSDARMRLVVEDDATVRVTSLSGQGRIDGVDVGDEAGHGATWQDGTFETSGRAFRLVRGASGEDRRAGEVDLRDRTHDDTLSGTIVFNRPPRAVPESAGPALALPAPVPSKRVDRSTTEKFRRALAERWTSDRDRLRTAHPDLAEAIELAQRRDPSLWQRRRDHSDAYHLAIGLGNLPWSPPVRSEPHDPAAALDDVDDWTNEFLDALGPLPMVPVVVDLHQGRGVGIVGPSPSGRSLARGLLIEAAVTHGPSDLGVVILTTDERASSWEWVKWLPHVRATGTHGVITTRAGFEQWGSRTERHAAELASAGIPSPITLVVIDGSAWWRDRDAPLRAVFADGTLPLRFVALAATRADVPAPCTTVVTSHPDDSVSVDHVAERLRIGGVLPFLATAADALQVARRLSPLDDPELPDWTSATPRRSSSVSMVGLLELDETDAPSFVTRWTPAAADTSVTLGRTDDGTVRVDLATHGPHMLLVGEAPGSGHLVRSVVTGLAVDHSPNDLHIVLVDGSGTVGSTAHSLSDLPHVVGVVTDVDRYQCDRVLGYLRREVRRRNAVGDGFGPPGNAAADATAAPSRLVVVVEDCVAVAAVAPDFVASLVDIARDDVRGEFHVIMATRTAPTGDAAFDALIELADVRVATGIQDDATLLAVIGTAAAANTGVEEPARSWIRRRDGSSMEFQAPMTIAATPSPSGVDVRPFVVAREPTAMERRLERAQTTALTEADDAVLAMLVTAMTEATVQLGLGDQRRVIPDPLPDAIPMREFFDDHPGDGVPFALVDDIDAQRLSPAWWQPTRGDLLVRGPEAAARVLVPLALGIAERHSPDDVHLYLVDDDAGHLAPLGRLPHCGALCASGDRDRISDLARFLLDEFDRRSALATEFGGPGRVAASEPSIVVMIADVGELGKHRGDMAQTDRTVAAFERVHRDGCTLGICTVVAAPDGSAVPEWLADDDRLVIDLSAPTDGVVAGGRALRADDGATVQLVDAPADARASVRALGLEPATQRPPRSVTRTSPHDPDVTDEPS